MPAVSASRLSAEGLRSQFQEQFAWQPEIISDRDLGGESVLRHAAVLLAVVHLHGQSQLLLTTRPRHLRSHSGQIALPGGRVEDDDDHRIATALREADEEIGLRREHVQVLGELPEYETGSGFAVTPVVAWVDELPSLRLDPNEVDEIFFVPMSFLMDPRNHERLRMPIGTSERKVYAMPWRSPERNVEYFIWGVTAAILRNFYHFLAAGIAQTGK